MEFSFKENRAYLMSKNIFRLSWNHTQKDEFKKHDTLKKRIEKSLLCITSLIVKILIAKPGKEKTETMDDLIHLASGLVALYDIALDLKLIENKDLNLIETASKELIGEIEKLK